MFILILLQDIAKLYKIFPDDVLGSGQFGIVYGGKSLVSLAHVTGKQHLYCYDEFLVISLCYARIKSLSIIRIVMFKIGVKETTMIDSLKRRKLSYAGHIMRNTSGHYDTLLRTIEGRLDGNRGRGRPRRTWVDDIREWTGLKRYERAVERRNLQWTFATHSSGHNNE